LSLARAAAPSEVTLDHGLNLHVQDFTPIHLRFGQVLQHPLHAARSIASTCRLCSLHHGSTDLVAKNAALFIRHRFTLAVAWLQVNVEFRKILIRILEQEFVHFFSEHALILLIETGLHTRSLRIRLLADIMLVKLPIDYEVSSSIPHLGLAATTTRHVIINAVFDFVSNQKDSFRLGQLGDEVAVVVEIAPVGCSSGAPLFISCVL